MKLGAFTFVLHSHLPYCRRAGRWPHGEEWLHESAAETYLPLLNALYDLAEAELPVHLTMGITPILSEQLADPLVREHFVLYLEERRSRRLTIVGSQNDKAVLAKEEHSQWVWNLCNLT